MDVRSYEARQDKKLKNKEDNESGGDRKESPGTEVEVVWACDEKRGALICDYVGRRAMVMTLLFNAHFLFKLLH